LGKKVLFRAPKDIAGELNFVKGLVEKGSSSLVIDRKYPLEKIAEAYAYLASGQKIGNVIITWMLNHSVIGGILNYYHKFWDGHVYKVWCQLNQRLLK